MIAWLPGIIQEVQQYFSKCKKCQINRTSLGKTVSTWLEADIWDQLLIDWGYDKDLGNILVLLTRALAGQKLSPREIEHQK